MRAHNYHFLKYTGCFTTTTLIFTIFNIHNQISSKVYPQVPSQALNSILIIKTSIQVEWQLESNFHWSLNWGWFSLELRPQFKLIQTLNQILINKDQVISHLESETVIFTSQLTFNWIVDSHLNSTWLSYEFNLIDLWIQVHSAVNWGWLRPWINLIKTLNQISFRPQLN